MGRNTHALQKYYERTKLSPDGRSAVRLRAGLPKPKEKEYENKSIKKNK